MATFTQVKRQAIGHDGGVLIVTKDHVLAFYSGDGHSYKVLDKSNINNILSTQLMTSLVTKAKFNENTMNSMAMTMMATGDYSSNSFWFTTRNSSNNVTKLYKGEYDPNTHKGTGAIQYLGDITQLVNFTVNSNHGGALSVYNGELYLMTRPDMNTWSLYKRPKNAVGDGASSWTPIFTNKNLTSIFGVAGSLYDSAGWRGTFAVSDKYFIYSKNGSGPVSYAVATLSANPTLVDTHTYGSVYLTAFHFTGNNTLVGLGPWSVDDALEFSVNADYFDAKGISQAVDVYVSYSTDGVIFTDYELFNPLSAPQARFLKFKTEISGGLQEGEVFTFEFDQSKPETTVELDDFLESVGSNIRYKTLYNYPLTRDVSHADGELYEVTIDKTQWKKITKLLVK